jgi:bifunctional UDP-N-acetylglucosamine pyrophosphorylase / glucosamine-1-phosphate N-acetyltransferase
MKKQKLLAAIILAAGKGTRMKSGKTNKVALHLADKPLILHSIHLLEKMSFRQIVVVVGFAKDSVKNVLKDTKVYFAEQKKRMGTAHAVKKALGVIGSSITDVLVIQGDDSHFYDMKTISRLVDKHFKTEASLTFLTIDVSDPSGLGRIVRDGAGNVVSIIEEKDADLNIKKIKEVNPACYIFNMGFLKKYIRTVPRSGVTKEYYLTSLIDIAIKNKKKVETLKGGNMPWRGVNTKEELKEAEKIYKKLIG